MKKLIALLLILAAVMAPRLPALFPEPASNNTEISGKHPSGRFSTDRQDSISWLHAR